MEDSDVWIKYPHLRFWLNKLDVAVFLGYECGPCGVPPTESDWYVVRPIYNLGGMGAGAEKVWIEAGDVYKVPPGYFWCEWFEGPQHSTTFVKTGSWFVQSSCWKAIRAEENPIYKFDKWIRSDFRPHLPWFLDEGLIISGVKFLNIEMIGNNIIEIHFRNTPDPDYDELVPIWAGEENLIDKLSDLGYKFIESYDDSNGYLQQARLGFMVK